MRTQVGIVGAGPAGLVLARLLHLQGIESVVLEARSQKYCQDRVRAGVLEQNTVDLLNEMGVGQRMQREGILLSGVSLRFDGQTHRVDFRELTSGRTITIYGQNEIIKDLIEVHQGQGLPIWFEVDEAGVHDIDSEKPHIRFRHQGRTQELYCDFIAGCDGFHGICRPSIPAKILTVYEKVYPFGWLGILSPAPRPTTELIYAYHQGGFALASLRPPDKNRLYVQCNPDQCLDAWPDSRIWRTLRDRLVSHDDERFADAQILHKSITKMHCFVVEPMRCGRLFLLGDAAHILPPAGAKGLNLAVADARILARALTGFYTAGRTDLLAAYSSTCLRRTWAAQRFACWMTSVFHRFDTDNLLDQRRQLAELEYVTGSRTALKAFAEEYVGPPRTAPMPD